MGRVECCGITMALLCLLIVIDLSLTESCGKRKVVNPLIVNGTEAKDGHWPWHAAIFHRDRLSFTYACGGTILDQNTVLTAAHCVMTSHGLIARKRLTVQVGRQQLSAANGRVQEYKAMELIVHPEYSFSSIKHDIALILLATDITYTDYIQPICLWNQPDDMHLIVGTWGTMIGFGIDETDEAPDTLREATIPVVSHMTCIESNREFFGLQLTSNMFCAGNRDGVSACNGDSGGGLFINNNDTWLIRGVVSFTKPLQNGNKCDTKEYTVFTDVVKYLGWIEQHMTGTVDQPMVHKNEINHKHHMTGTSEKPIVNRAENIHIQHMLETEVQPIVPLMENTNKIGLLPLSTCGPNPYVSRVELSKPVFLGYPWMGLIECTNGNSKKVRTNYQAILISDFYLITTGSGGSRIRNCWQSSVLLGEYDMNRTMDCTVVDRRLVCSPPVQTRRIESVIMHPEYHKASKANDIALIRLQDQADTSQRNVKPICLPVTNELRSQKSTEYIQTSWNYDHSARDVKPVLQMLLRKILPMTECQEQYTARYILSTHQMCTQVTEKTFKDCQNALLSAPLQLVQQVQGNSRYVLHGILSFQFYCNSHSPDVYTNLASYVEWILENMKE